MRLRPAVVFAILAGLIATVAVLGAMLLVSTEGASVGKVAGAGAFTAFQSVLVTLAVCVPAFVLLHPMAFTRTRVLATLLAAGIAAAAGFVMVSNGYGMFPPDRAHALEILATPFFAPYPVI